VVTTLDQGADNFEVHSPYKQAVGRRAALGVAALTGLVPNAPYLAPAYDSGTDAGIGSAGVKLQAAGLYGAALNTSTGVTCPQGLPAANCEAFAILSAPDCTWHDAAAAPGASRGFDLLLSVTNTSAWVPGSRTVATRALYANWPVVTVTNVHGTPLVPWLAYVEGAASDECPLIPPPRTPAPSPPPPMPTPHPSPGPGCNLTAPAGFHAQQQQGWWKNFSTASMGGAKTVADCAAACDKAGPACLAFHSWEPCTRGDCYLYFGRLDSFAAHSGSYAYQRLLAAGSWQ
jgi:hypothetical protein